MSLILHKYEQKIREDIRNPNGDDNSSFIWADSGMILQVPIPSEIGTDSVELYINFAVDAIDEKLQGKGYTEWPQEEEDQGSYFKLEDGVFIHVNPKTGADTEIYIMRGWGRIQYYKDVKPSRYQDLMAEWILDALNSKLKCIDPLNPKPSCPTQLL